MVLDDMKNNIIGPSANVNWTETVEYHHAVSTSDQYVAIWALLQWIPFPVAICIYFKTYNGLSPKYKTNSLSQDESLYSKSAALSVQIWR